MKAKHMEFQNIKTKYTLKLSEVTKPEIWNNKTIEEFFKTNRYLIANLIKEYPKINMDGILMLKGMDLKDRPFQKELLQAKIMKHF